MNFSTLHNTFDLIDLYKALFALAAGIILGLERELKDKAAGLKTITVICLGSCLFTILSAKVGNEYTDGARIASYVVSGIGFLGAGVIFRDGLNVSGLTTAGIIWIASAIGMAIGFGEIYAAAIFLLACLVIIYTGTYLNLAFLSGKTKKVLKIVLLENNAYLKDSIVATLKTYVSKMEQTRLESYSDKIVVTLNIMIVTTRLPGLERFLIEEERIESFDF